MSHNQTAQKRRRRRRNETWEERSRYIKRVCEGLDRMLPWPLKDDLGTLALVNSYSIAQLRDIFPS